MRARGARSIDVREEVERASDREVQARFAGHGVDSSATRGTATTHGRIVTNWPGYMREYRSARRTLDASEFDFIPLAHSPAGAGASAGDKRGSAA